MSRSIQMWIVAVLFALAWYCPASAGECAAETDHQIVAHLVSVESQLRAQDVSHLTDVQQERRLQHLDTLNEYTRAGQFPHNHTGAGRERPFPFPQGFPELPCRTPVFVDEHGTHCAVGALLAADGQGEMVSRIVAESNLLYVHEMRDPEISTWARENGFSVDELAMIQPQYACDDCVSDVDCAMNWGGSKCHLGRCVEECTSDLDCDGLKVCRQNFGAVCEFECGLDSDCDGGYCNMALRRCVSNDCQSNSDCPVTWVCDQEASLCRPECIADSDCSGARFLRPQQTTVHTGLSVFLGLWRVRTV